MLAIHSWIQVKRKVEAGFYKKNLQAIKVFLKEHIDDIKHKKSIKLVACEHAL